MKYLLTSIFLILSIYTFGRVRDKDNRQQVLKTDKVGKEFKFFNSKDSTTTYLTYLGKLYTTKGKTYKIMTSAWIWSAASGLKRFSGRVLVFNNHNRYLGNYYGFGVDEFPRKIINNKLLFSSHSPPKGNASVSYISFKNGLPKELYNEPAGDLYAFDISN